MSAIVSATIDADFPVAGQDNDSQGFRDNFRIIKDGLATANSEITVLEQNTAKLNADNNFNKKLIDNAKTNRLQGLVYSQEGTISISEDIDYENGEYQIFSVSNNTLLRFTNWPGNSVDERLYAKIKVELSGSGTITFTADGGSEIRYLNGASESVVLPASGSILLDVWTTTGGSIIYIAPAGEADAEFTIGDLDDIANVTINTGSLANNHVLKWSAGGEVWISGQLSYNDLADTPTIPAAQVNSDWTASSGLAQILNKPSIPVNLADLADVDNASPTSGQVLKWNGTAWAPANDIDTDTDTKYYTGSEDLADAGAADLTKSVSWFATAGAETATLAAGTEGQIKTFIADTAVGNMVITVTNPGWGGAGTITFATAGQACTLQYINSKWFCIGNNGASFA